MQSMIRVRGGRGFVVSGASEERYVITAAHCLPRLPTRAWFRDDRKRTYKSIMARLGKRPRVWAECLFVDPVADIAVLGSPDNQEFRDEARAYDKLVETVTLLAVSDLHAADIDDGRAAQLFPLAGPPFRCIVHAAAGGPMWIEADTEVVPGMSGSPILAEDGSAIGVVARGDEGPCGPRLAAHLPGWLLAELGFTVRVGARTGSMLHIRPGTRRARSAAPKRV